MHVLDKNIEKYLSAFENHFNGEKLQPFHQTRKSAAATFGKLGFPDTKQEEWRFTNIAPLIKSDFIAAPKKNPAKLSPKDIEPFKLKEWQGSVIVFIDGYFSVELSDLDFENSPVSIKPLSDALQVAAGPSANKLNTLASFENDAFTALNTAFLNDGVSIQVPPNTVLNEDIHLLHISVKENTMSSPRSLIELGGNSQATIVESYHTLSAEPVFVNCVSELFIGENAHLHHYKLQNESEKSYHISQTAIKQAANSTYTAGGFDFGGKLVRHNISTLLNGEGITSTLNGLYIANNKQHIDNHTFIDHAKAHCDSHELYRGILKDKAKGVFSGKILVRQEAQKTDAKQSNNCLLLSEDAQVDAKPQLEIYADDVKCTHGATIGQLDEEAIFYLQARGIPRKKAKSMLTYAFAEELIAGVKNKPLQSSIEELLLKNLDK